MNRVNELIDYTQKSVSAHLFDFLFRYGEAHQIRRAAVCRAAGIRLSDTENPDARLPATAFAGAWKTIAGTLADPWFGLNLGRSLEHFPFSHITFGVMRNSQTLFSALENLIRYHNLLSDVATPEIRREKAFVTLILESDIPEMNQDIQYTWFVFVMILSLVRYLGGNDLCPVETRFSQAPPKDAGKPLTEFFRSPVRFRAATGELVFRKADLESGIRLADSGMLPHYEMAADKRLRRQDQDQTWRQRVESAILAGQDTERIKLDGTTLDRICGRMGVGRRKLQARLKAEGTSFREIHGAIRTEKAKALLRDREIPIVEIAFALGFSEQSAFHHAFRKWTGSTPGEYRKRRIQPVP